ncbi:MAG: lysylphosphatidylglycerol synthase transmembrane domain-containing protein [Acidobacteriota bacterium]
MTSSGPAGAPTVGSSGTRATWAIGLTISAFFLWLAVRGTAWRDLALALGDLEPIAAGPLLAAAATFSILHLGARGARWRLLVAPLGDVSTRRLAVVQWIGAALDNVLPARAGDVARAALLRRDGIAGSAAFGTIIVERAIDVLATQLLLAAALFVLPVPRWLLALGVATPAISILGLLTIAWLLRDRRRLRRWLKRLPQRLHAAAERIGEAFLNGLQAAWRPGVTPAIVGWSLAVHACNLLASWAALAACGVEGSLSALGAAMTLAVTTYVAFAVMLPAAPGQLGTLHFACVTALAHFLVPTPQALAFALVYHATQYLPVTAGGAFLLWREVQSGFAWRRDPGAATQREAVDPIVGETVDEAVLLQDPSRSDAR